MAVREITPLQFLGGKRSMAAPVMNPGETLSDENRSAAAHPTARRDGGDLAPAANTGTAAVLPPDPSPTNDKKAPKAATTPE